MDRSKASSFTAYLEEKQRRKAQQAAPSPGGGTALSLLAALAAAPDRSMPISGLQAASGMSFTDFSQAVQRLSESGYLTLSGEPGHEVAQLSKLGAEVAALARPA